MRRLAHLFVALLGCHGAWAQEAEHSAARVVNLEPGAGPEACTRAFEVLATRYPDRLKVTRYGRSSQGRPLLLVRLLSRDAAAAPAVLLVPDLVTPPNPGVIHQLLRELLASWEAQPELALLDPLGAAEWWFLPAPDPDRLAPDPAPRSVSLARDFPSGWRYDQVRTGPWPLSRPETRALARLVDGSPRLTVLGLLGSAPTARDQAGGLGRYVRDRRAAGVLELPCDDSLLGRLRDLAAGLPRLDVSVLVGGALGDGVRWVELVVTPVGSWSPGDVRGQVLGLQPLAWSLRGPGERSFSPLAGEELQLSGLAPGSSVRLRAVLAGSQEGTPQLELTATRAATVRANLLLSAGAAPDAPAPPR